MSRTTYKRRIPVNVEAKLIRNNCNHEAVVGNMSENGLFVLLLTPIKKADLSDTSRTIIIMHTPNGGQITLVCEHRWLSPAPADQLIKGIGMEIIDVPQEYRTFYRSKYFELRNSIVRNPIAVIGMACFYPGAPDLRHFWENILARRRAFRRIPNQRLPLAEYYDPDPATQDKTYATQSAVIDGFEFDWIAHGIPKPVVESTDISHWIALEISLRALQDAGYSRYNMPSDRSGVIVGNTLTGENSRAEFMRLRWPFVRKALLAASAGRGLSPELIEELSTSMEGIYKSVFAPVTEDTLAGNLSNTIAGRICNYLDLNGGGYTVDGACSSSLIAVATAANALSAGNLDLALAGGVDISLDTFELIGFAKTGALARKDMRVYDRRASGFIPGEGAGFVVLKRLEDAYNDGDRVYAVLRGWSLSSDGKGGITAPKAERQALAIRKAYTQSGYAVQDIDFIEGHGTGTPAGDRAELNGIELAMDSKHIESLRSCGITSLKSIIGHTKAASGIGGFIKGVMAVNRRILPPTAGCQEPNELFQKGSQPVYPITRGIIRNSEDTLRAGISGMGFGGINCHVTIESGPAPAESLEPSLGEKELLASFQETEVFILSAGSAEDLLQQIDAMKEMADGISIGELVDLSKHMSFAASSGLPVRASLIASTPEELIELCHQLEKMVKGNAPYPGEIRIGDSQKIWLGNSVNKPRVGFLFPGQGSQQLNMGIALVERYSWARDLLSMADEMHEKNSKEKMSSFMYRPIERVIGKEKISEWKQALSQSEIAQPAICLTSLLWMHCLERLGIRPVAVGGHSLGELTAFHAAGAFDQNALLELASFRGRAMASEDERIGTMAVFGCNGESLEKILEKVKGYAVVANINSPKQTVLSGEFDAVEQAVQIASESGIPAKLLPVSNAFHSKFVDEAAGKMRNVTLIPERLKEMTIRLISSVEGCTVKRGMSIRDHFADQIVSRVDFISLANSIKNRCDLLIEVGPGQVLSGLVKALPHLQDTLCFPVEPDPENDRALNILLGAYFVHGGTVNWQTVFENRLVRPFVPASQRAFIENPCERPFAIPDPVTRYSSPWNGGSLESAMAGATAFPQDVISEYLSQRGPFLKEVINADLKHSFRSEAETVTSLVGAHMANEPASSPPAKRQEPPKGNKGGNGTSAEGLLLELVEKRTGFPRESISMNLRLLDDLNLDSIKAAELVASAAQHLGIAGDVDASRLANATIREVASELENYLGQAAGPTRVSEKPEEDISELLLDLVEQRTGFPRETLSMGLRLLDDLNLDSIKAADLIASVAVHIGAAGDINTSQLANATLSEIAEVLGRYSDREKGKDVRIGVKKTSTANAARKAPWVRNFVMKSVREDLPSSGMRNDQLQQWAEAEVVILCEEGEDTVASLERELTDMGTSIKVLNFSAIQKDMSEQISPLTHCIAILPRMANDGSPHEKLERMVERLRAPLAFQPLFKKESIRPTVAYVQFGGGSTPRHASPDYIDQACASGFAASLHHEQPDIKVRALDFAPDIGYDLVAKCIVNELSMQDSYGEALYDSELNRYVRRPDILDPSDHGSRSIEWTSADVVLVTGGAKGITAECALSFARTTGARMVLVGTSPHPDGNGRSSEVSKTLERFSSEGLSCSYYSCDITDAKSVETLVQRVQQDIGNITGVIHGAGLNRPRRVDTVSEDEALAEIRPKVLGALYLCNALRDAALKVFVGFSSIIGITGMPGNAWYGFSNEVLDSILRHFGAERSDTKTLSLAFSIWEEVGMGARMGSVETLAKMGIGAIPTREGVKRFLDLTLDDHGESQVVIASRLGDLDTWNRKHFPYPCASRFLENVQIYEPGIEVIARARLGLERDMYVKHHEWRGTYLFPTVFGLEAMAQAVAYVTGYRDFETVVIEDINLQRPITVPEDGECTIEIHAQVLEHNGARDESRVRVGIACDQTGFMTDHFSATFVIGKEPGQERKDTDIPGKPLDIEPQRDLYGGLLFQGPLYQRISEIYALDSKTCTFRSERDAPPHTLKDFEGLKDSGEWLLGDPFFRDSLLHAAQLPLSPDICLPVQISTLERHRTEKGITNSLTGKVIVEERSGNEYRTSVFVVNQDGHVVEHLKGYTLRVMNHDDSHPLPEEMVDPGQRDEKIVQNELSAGANTMDVILPAYSLSYLSGFHKLNKTDRHERELPILHDTVQRALGKSSGAGENVRISWLDSGKPSVEGVKKLEIDVSLSHDGDTVLCVAGQAPQGCDIEAIQERTEDTWSALFKKDEELMLRKLLESGDSVDEAGTRIWAAREVVFKVNGSKDFSIQIRKRNGDTVLFQMQDTDPEMLVLTFPVRLTRGPARMIALIVRSEMDHRGPSGNGTISHHAERLHFDFESYKADIVNGSLGQPVFVFHFPVTFREASNLSRTLYFSHYFAWIGKLRELVIHPIYDQLVESFKTGKWGMVTNHAATTIYGEAQSGDIIEGRVWVDRISGTESSTIEVSYEWWKKLPDGNREKIALSTMSTTWVAILGHGTVEVRPLPDFCKEFFTRLLPTSSSSKITQPESGDEKPVVPFGDELYREPVGPVRPSSLLAEHVFETTLEDANLVGNIYFSNYYIWQGRTRDQFLKEKRPEYFDGSGEQGEFRCVKCKIDHMSEAMPFERIAVRMYRSAVFERGVRLYFDFYSLSSNGKYRKLGFGEQKAIWYAPNEDGKWTPSTLPAGVLSVIMPTQ